MLQAGKFQQVFSITAKSDTAIGMIVNNGLGRVKSARRREDIDAAMEEGMMEIVPRLEKRTHYLATLGDVVTLLGAARYDHRPHQGVHRVVAPR